MLKNITRALSLSLLVHTSIYANNESVNLSVTEEMLDKYGSGFASLEHKNMGDLVRLQLPSTNESMLLTLPNGIKLTYGEIVMFAGDMFGNPAQPISNCSKKNRSSCFQAQFEALGVKGDKNDTRCTNPINYLVNLQGFMNGVETELAQSRQNGVDDWVFYHEHDSEHTKQLNKFTCGGSFISRLIPFGNYLKLAQVNFDHFVPDSLIAYKSGHRYALETALKGFQKNQTGQIEEANKLLELAYAQNAFANHYLTDSFSAGHMRTPRRAIDNTVLLPAILNLIIANLMHDEDNRNGLNVVNAEGTSWTAYGDGYLYRGDAGLQKTVMLNAMQRSADGVYNTFTTGVIPEVYPEMSLFPDYKKIEQLNQSSPLFKVENGEVLKRVNSDDYYDQHWTRYWSGLTTLIEFKIIN